ncbi:MAG: MscL family protein [Acidimicrobiales bacterium]
MLKGFKEFITKGNIIDLAVAFVIGIAFAGLVSVFTSSLIEPLINLILGGGVDGGTIEVNGQVFDFGAVINAAINFIITAAVLYFAVVAPYNAYRNRRTTAEQADMSNEEKMINLLEQIARKST